MSVCFLPCPCLPRVRGCSPVSIPHLCASPPSSSSSAPSADIFTTFSSRLRSLSNDIFDTLPPCPLPSFQLRSTHHLLPPPGPPKAVLHFLGGAFFSAAPHLLYATFLQRLSQRGYLVVATPYDLSFNKLELSADIAARWARLEQYLALEYGDLPVFGLSHSAGGVTELLLSSLFQEDIPRVGSVFVSLSNRSAQAAIPGLAGIRAGAADVVAAGEDVRGTVRDWRNWVDTRVDQSQWVPGRVKKDWERVKEGRRVVEQVWAVIEELGDGQAEFYPSAEDVWKVAERQWDGQGLVVGFEGDGLDDGKEMVKRVRGVKGIWMDGGGHLTTLDRELGTDGLIGMLEEVRLRELEKVVRVVDEWIEKRLL